MELILRYLFLRTGDNLGHCKYNLLNFTPAGYSGFEHLDCSQLSLLVLGFLSALFSHVTKLHNVSYVH